MKTEENSATWLRGDGGTSPDLRTAGQQTKVWSRPKGSREGFEELMVEKIPNMVKDKGCRLKLTESKTGSTRRRHT